MRLETGRISEAEFAAEEKTLLERLDRTQKRGRGIEAEEGGEELYEPSERKKIA